MPWTIAALTSDLASRCALQLTDVGAYLDTTDPSGSHTAVFIQGLRRGLTAVGIAPVDPTTPSDPDVAYLTGWAAERVLDEAERLCLSRVLSRWHLLLAAQGVAPTGGDPAKQEGTLAAEQRAVRARLADLNALCSEPYCEPSSGLAVDGGLSTARPRAGPWW